ncbi:MAG: aldo/keto reductase [Anaerolineaceae bacterium]|nr:aldo/keto reductase [Anaerolineaceae bacterium]
MFKRRLGHSDLEVSAIGLGCWAIGGPWEWLEDDGSKSPDGLGQVDDAESIRAIHYALDSGINFFDTAANYGCGHSERILAQAIAGRRDKVILATKFGYVVDEENLTVTEPKDVVSRIRQECESSLRNLQTDFIDLYQFHKGDYPPEKAAEVCDVLETLVDEGKIRWYGWSTDDVERARLFAQGKHCVAIQHRLNMKDYYPKMLAVCDEYDQASINRSPLVSGFLTGKYNVETTFPKDDVRSTWSLQDERTKQALQKIEFTRKFFADAGEVRTLTQIALAWLWTCSNRTIPIPGFKTVAQVKENIQAIEFGLLSKEYMKKIDEIFERPPVIL